MRSAGHARGLSPHPDNFQEAARPLGRVERVGYDVDWSVRVFLDGGKHWLNVNRNTLAARESEATCFTSLVDARDAVAAYLPNGIAERAEIVRSVCLAFDEVVEPLNPLSQLALQAYGPGSDDSTEIPPRPV